MLVLNGIDQKMVTVWVMIVVSLYDMVKDSYENVILNFKCFFFLLGKVLYKALPGTVFFLFLLFPVILGSENFILVFGYHTLTLTCFSGCIAFLSDNFHFFACIVQGDGTLLATGSYDGQARIWGTNGKIS